MTSSYGKAKKVLLLGLDGADPLLVQRYIKEGKLPNFKRVLDGGVSTVGYSMQAVLPAITPPNWASLATGAWPSTHGVSCFWNHTLGNPLDQLEYGFNSNLLKAEPIWRAYARQGKKSILFNYPTAWPPTTENDIYVDGTSVYTNLSGNIDYEKVYECIEGNFPIEEISHILDNSGTDCRVEGEVSSIQATLSKEEHHNYGYEDPELVTSEATGESISEEAKSDKIKTPIKDAVGWKNAPTGAKEVILPVNNGGSRRYGLIIAEDGTNYNTIKIYLNKQSENPLGEAKVNEWSDWIYDTYIINGKNTKVAYKIRVISFDPDGSNIKLYSSFVLDLYGGKYFFPEEIGGEIYDKAGPMLQPVNYDRLNPTADQIMLESVTEMYHWHERAINYLLANKEWDLFYIHLHGIDMYNHYYLDYTFEESSPEYERYQELIYKIYEVSDNFIGEMLKHLDEDTTIFVVSDHGGVGKNPGVEIPLIGDMWGLNTGVMGDLGYTKIKEVNGVPKIDWENTTAVAQRATFIYVNLKGRDPDGIVDPKDYDALVTKIIDDLYNYRDPKTGKRVISFALNREDMGVLGVGGENGGDIFYILEPEFTRCHGNGLSNHSLLGYSMNALFAAIGAGIKKGEIIDRKVKVVDIVPTISYLSGTPIPKNAEGGIIYQALEE